MKKKSTGASSLLGPVPLTVSFEWRTPRRKLSLVVFLSFRRLSPPLSSSPPHFYSKYRGSATRGGGGGGRSFAADRNARLFPPVSRCAARLYPRFTIFMPDSRQSGHEFRGRSSRVRRRVVELWKAAAAAAVAAPCHCLKFSYPLGSDRCFIQLRARTPCLSLQGTGIQINRDPVAIFFPHPIFINFINSVAKNSLKRAGVKRDLRSGDTPIFRVVELELKRARCIDDTFWR